MDESASERNSTTKTTNQKVAKPYLNKPVNCPWTSRAPLSSSSNFKSENNTVSLDNCSIREQYNSASINNGFNRGTVNHQTSTQFFHFLRLMQLFPDVHPATLHTVMTLCKNDFFSTVDKLLYAKRCKDLIMKRRQFLVPNNKPKIRCQPYPCSSNFNENIKIVLNYKKNEAGCNEQQSNNQQTQTNWDGNFPSRSMDSKRFVYKNKSKATKDSKTDAELTPVASPHCELPIKPLSPQPNVVQDLTKQNKIKNEI